jgi:hypothetical protein
MRLFEKSLIYYQSDPSCSSDSYGFHPPRLVYEHFCPAQPRRRPQPQPKDSSSPPSSSSSSSSSSSITYERQDHAMPSHGFALQFLNRSCLSEPRVSVQSRIVVIGATPTTASFLQRFLLNSQLFYPNVTLISPTGFPSPKPSNNNTACHKSSCQLINEDMPDEAGMNALTLESRCRLLQASVAGINRQDKTVTLCRTDRIVPSGPNNNSNQNRFNTNQDVLPYDYLIITDECVDSTKFGLAERNGDTFNLRNIWNSNVEVRPMRGACVY